jgi:ABC-type branched-subunit amino acid transport system substrate-binding protein
MMNTNRLRITWGSLGRSAAVLGLVAATVCVGLACSGDTPKDVAQKDASKPTTTPWVIFASLSLDDNASNTFRGLALGQRQGAELAESEINAIGGILGRNIEVRVRDDKYQEAAYKALIDEALNQVKPQGSLVGFLGPIPSGFCLNNQSRFFEAEVVQMAVSAGAKELSTAQPPRDRFFFRTAAPHQRQARAMAIFAKNTIKCAKVQVINSNDAFGVGTADALEIELQDRAIPTTSPRLSFDPKVPANVFAKADPTVLLPKNDWLASIAAGAPSAGQYCQIMIAAGGAAASIVTSETDAEVTLGTPNPLAKVSLTTIGSNTMKTPDLLGVSDPKKVEGIYGTLVDTAPDTEEFKAFKRRFFGKFGQPVDPNAPPPAYSANTYDAVILMSLALERAGGVADLKKYRDALFSVSREGEPVGPSALISALNTLRSGAPVNYNGASGATDFDDSGDVVNDFEVWRVQTPSGGTQGFARVQIIPAREVK